MDGTHRGIIAARMRPLVVEHFGAGLVRSLINNFNPQLIALDA